MPTKCYPSTIYASDAWHQRVRAQSEKMAAGPLLDDDGHTLVVPSEWYNEDAVRFWKSKGFEWRPKTATWERDTRKPLDGETYTPQAWLTATRRQFYQFWPACRLPEQSGHLLESEPPPRRGRTRNGICRKPPAEPIDPETQAKQQAALANLRRRQQERKEEERHYVEG